MELVRVTKSNGGKSVVSARDLHEFLIKDANGGQIGEDFSHWIKRCLDYGFLENQDYAVIEFDYAGNVLAKNSESDNQAVRVHKRDYILTLDTSKHIAMIQNNDKGKQARLYFIECERQLQLQAPKTFREALLLAAEQQLQIEQQQALLELQAPKVMAFENVINSATTYTLDSVSDTLDIGRTTLCKILEKMKWKTLKEKNGTSSTRFAEEAGFAKTVFEYIKIGSQDIKTKRLVIKKAGMDKLVDLHIKNKLV